MKNLVENIKNKIEKKRVFKEKQKAIRAHIKDNRPHVEHMKNREEFYKGLLAERAERLSKQAEIERRLYIQSLIDKQLKESQES